MEALNKVFLSVLNRSDLSIEKVNNEYVITKVKANHSPVNLHRSFAFILSVIGVLAVLFLSLVGGIILLVSAIPLYVKTSNLKKREDREKGKVIKFTDEGIVIHTSHEVTRIGRDQIQELSYQIEKDKDISVGIISVTTIEEDNSNVEYKLLEIFGDDKRYVEDDTNIIVTNLANILNE